MIETLLADLNWANITAVILALGTLAKMLGDRASTKRASIRAASKSVAEEWEALCAKQQARIEQLADHLSSYEERTVAVMARYEARIVALETELEQTRIERDTERGQRQALERKVADLEKEIEALRRQANRVRP